MSSGRRGCLGERGPRLCRSDEVRSLSSDLAAPAIPPMRPIGSIGTIAAFASAFPRLERSTIAVRTTPVQTALIRVPWAAYSRAAVRVKPRRPCLLAVYAAIPEKPTVPATDEQFTIAPVAFAHVSVDPLLQGLTVNPLPDNVSRGQFPHRSFRSEAVAGRPLRERLLRIAY